MDLERFVFIDETATATNMTRRYGRCPSHRRLVAKAPYGHWRTTTFVTTFRNERDHGTAGIRRADGRRCLPRHAEQFLAPVLRPGDVVVMDDLSAHKVAGVRQAIESIGVSVLYLPAYSPDLNLIEQVFAKIKAILRKVAARTKDAHRNAICVALEQCDADEFESYLRNCEYGST